MTPGGRVPVDEDSGALAWIRDVLGDEIADLAASMPRTSPMTE